MKTSVRVLLIALAAIMLISASGVSVFANSKTTGSVTADVKLSYSSEMVYFGWIPVYVTITNNTDKVINGTVTVKIYDVDMYDYNYYTLKSDFSLAGQVKKTVELPLYSSGGNVDTYVCEIKDEKGKTLYSSGEISIVNQYKYYSSQRPFLIGYMTENEKDTNYFKSLDGREIQNNFIIVEHLTPERFPSSEIMIQDFSVIFVGNIDTTASSSYSKQQLDILKNYINNGGAVVIGTGAKGSATLRGFSEYFSSDLSSVCQKAEATRRTSFFIRNFNEFQSTSSSIDLRSVELCSISDNNFEQVTNYPGQDTFVFMHKNKSLFVTGFDITADIGNYQLMPYMVMENILANNLKIVDFTFDNVYYPRLTASFMSSDNIERSPSGFMMALLMLAYIGIAVLGAYIYLRVKKKEKLMWVALPIFAVVFSVVFLIYGVIFKGSGFSSTINFVELNDSGANISSINSAVYLNKSGSYKLSFDTDGVVYSADGSTGMMSYYNKSSKLIVKSGADACTQTDAGKDSFVYFGGESINTDYKDFDVSISNDGNKIVALISNNTGRNLSDVTFRVSGMLYYVGDISAGEKVKKEFDIKKSTYDNLDVLYKICYEPAGISEADMNEDFLGDFLPTYTKYNTYYYRSKMFSGLTDSDIYYRRALLLEEILNYNTSSSGTDNRIFVFGFDEDAETKVLVNGRTFRRNICQTMVYKFIESGIDSSVLPDVYGEFTAVKGDTAENLTEMNGVNYLNTGKRENLKDIENNYAVYFITCPKDCNVNEIQVKLSTDESAEKYCFAYLFNPEIGQFSNVDLYYDGDSLYTNVFLSQYVFNKDVQEKYSTYKMSDDIIAIDSSYYDMYSGEKFKVYIEEEHKDLFKDQNVIVLLVHCAAEICFEVHGEDGLAYIPEVTSVIIPYDYIAYCD